MTSFQGPVGWQIHEFTTVTSTMDIAYEYALAGAPQGTTIIAEAQTAGRGQGERHWFSPPGCGLYLTTILRVPVSVERAAVWQPEHLSLVAGVSILTVLHDFGGRDCRLKWPNDIVWGQRKLAGILTLGYDLGKAEPWFLLGVGVNLASQREIQGLVECQVEVQRRYVGVKDFKPEVTRAELREQILGALAAAYATWITEGSAPFLERWQAADALYGVKICITDKQLEGVGAGLTADGGLRVAGADGQMQVIYTGGVEFVEA